jgi:hypothetical protein
MHIAGGHTFIGGVLEALLAGETAARLVPEELNARNAENALRFALAGKHEVFATLRAGSAAIAALVGGLSEAQLDRTVTFGGRAWTVRQFVESIVAGHPQHHGESIRAAVGAAAVAA